MKQPEHDTVGIRLAELEGGVTDDRLRRQLDEVQAVVDGLVERLRAEGKLEDGHAVQSVLLNLGRQALFRGIPTVAAMLGFARARARMLSADLDQILKEGGGRRR